MSAPAPRAFISDEQLEHVLGQASMRLVRFIAQQAQTLGHDLYLVGGAVRDVLLKRPTFDLDFAIESAVVPLVTALQAQLGGHVSHHQPFGTAKWEIEPNAGALLGAALDARLEHLDFASARYETYLHPTALPTVYPGSISQDLLRRDFTINTLALHLHPDHAHHAILDVCGGLQDLTHGQIRVLHDLSFSDDPTRIIRAMRFSHRFGFTIEAHSAGLIEQALPMLGRITGERLRNDLNLLLREDLPEVALMRLQRLGVLQAIHPAFHFSADHARWFEQARSTTVAWFKPTLPLEALYWHLVTINMPADDLSNFAHRLLFPHHLSASMLAACQLRLDLRKGVGFATPSEAYHRLKALSETALWATWLVSRAEVIEHYVTTWQHVRATTTGRTLQAAGLKPGPRYAQILGQLLDGRLNGSILNDQAEAQALEALLTPASGEDSG